MDKTVHLGIPCRSHMDVLVAATATFYLNTMVKVNCSSSSHLTEAFPTHVASSVVMGLSFGLGVPGNIAVLVILVRRVKEKSFILNLMLSLAVSDLLTLLPLPMWIWALLHNWIFGSVACKIISYVEYWFVFCSMFCVILMSIQRYMHVLHPQKWAKLGDTGQKCLLGAIWILSGVLALYAPIQREVGCKEYGFQYCNQQFKNDSAKIVTALLEMFQVLICFFLLVILYCCLHRGVNQSPFFSSSRMTRLVSRIVLMFFVSYVAIPMVNILLIIAISLKNESLVKTLEVAGKMARSLAFLNGCFNPFLYTFSFRGLHASSTSTLTS